MDGILIYKKQEKYGIKNCLAISESQKNYILKHFHYSPILRHFLYFKTLRRISDRFYWPGMPIDIICT